MKERSKRHPLRTALDDLIGTVIGVVALIMMFIYYAVYDWVKGRRD